MSDPVPKTPHSRIRLEPPDPLDPNLEPLAVTVEAPDEDLSPDVPVLPSKEPEGPLKIQPGIMADK